jgi:hypothetical protein
MAHADGVVDGSPATLLYFALNEPVPAERTGSLADGDTPAGVASSVSDRRSPVERALEKYFATNHLRAPQNVQRREGPLKRLAGLTGPEAQLTQIALDGRGWRAGAPVELRITVAPRVSGGGTAVTWTGVLGAQDVTALRATYRRHSVPRAARRRTPKPTSQQRGATGSHSASTTGKAR